MIKRGIRDAQASVGTYIAALGPGATVTLEIPNDNGNGDVSFLTIAVSPFFVVDNVINLPGGCRVASNAVILGWQPIYYRVQGEWHGLLAVTNRAATRTSPAPRAETVQEDV